MFVFFKEDEVGLSFIFIIHGKNFISWITTVFSSCEPPGNYLRII